MRQSEPLLLKPAEAADLLGVGRLKVYELIAEGSLPVVRIGRRLRVPLGDLKDWIKQQASVETAKTRAAE